MLLNAYTLLLILPLFCIATLTPKSKNREVKIKPEKVKSGPQNYSVFDRNLIVENPTAKEIVLNHQAYYADIEKRNFDGLVLGYVTPVSCTTTSIVCLNTIVLVEQSWLRYSENFCK